MTDYQRCSTPAHQMMMASNTDSQSLTDQQLQQQEQQRPDTPNSNHKYTFRPISPAPPSPTAAESSDCDEESVSQRLLATLQDMLPMLEGEDDYEADGLMNIMQDVSLLIAGVNASDLEYEPMDM